MDKLELNAAEDYIQYCEDNNLFPNGESFVIYYMKTYNKDYKTSKTLLGEYKGLIDIHSIAYLKNKIAGGGRNSLAYVQLLKEYTDKKDAYAGVDQVQIIVDIPTPSKRPNPTKLKYKGEVVK